MKGSGVYSLERSGITEDLFPIGERVRIAGWQWIDIGERFTPHDLCQPE